MSITVKDYMTTTPHTIGADRTIGLAIEMMAKDNFHHLPVLEGGQLVGIISDRDLELLKTSKNVEELKIKDVMNFEPFIVGPSTPIAKVAADMIEKGVGSAIVRAENSTPWGIFTITDALKVIRDHVH